MKLKIIYLCVFAIFAVNSFPTTYHIKLDGTGDFTSIQEGIDASANSDTVLVYTGTYLENIDFIGKDITVASLLLITGDESYINNTIIDGNQQGSVVTFENNETNDAVLMGFTLQNGSGYDVSQYTNIGGGIFINLSSPSLQYLIIKNNYADTGGGIAFSSSNAYLKSITITENHSFRSAGGLLIGRLAPNPINSIITFNATERCNIYNNTAGYAADIYIAENHIPITNIYLDTLTVSNPDWNYVSQFPNISLEIENEWLQQVEADLYVNPDGDDTNNGLSEADPLKTIQWALTKIKADSLNPHNIYLSEGIYSPATNGELFPLNFRSYISIIGAGVEETIFEEPIGKAAFIYGWYDNFIKLSSFTARNRTGNYITTSPINLSFSSSELSNMLIENCDCVDASAIGSTEDITITDVKIYNNNGMSSVMCGSYPYQEITAKLTNVIFIGNDQYEPSCGGGALSVSNRKYVSLKNCLFAKNHAYDNIWPNANIYLLGNDTLDFFNNIVCNNSSNGGALAVGDGGIFNIKNSIIYGNSNYQFQTHRGNEPTSVNISHSLIQGGTDPSILHIASPEPYGVDFIWGEGIIDEIPQFLGGDEYDPLYYQLTELSPCLDTGTPDTTGLFLPPWDLLHHQRIWDGDGNGSAIIDMGCYEFGADSLGVYNHEIPFADYELRNYPNPFNPSTTIAFSIYNDNIVELSIFNLKGQKITTLINDYLLKGKHSIIWSGCDQNDHQVGSGIYFYKIKVGKQDSVKRMLLLK